MERVRRFVKSFLLLLFVSTEVFEIRNFMMYSYVCVVTLLLLFCLICRREIPVLPLIHHLDIY